MNEETANAVQTIEEAYQESHDHDAIYHERSHKECCAARDRALALAVLAEAAQPESEIRARIEALGR